MLLQDRQHMKGTDKKNLDTPGGWRMGGWWCASGRKCAKWDFCFIKRLLKRLTALQRDKRRTWGTEQREERLPSRTDLTPTPRPNPSLYKIQKRRDEIRNPSLASVQHNQSCPAATSAQQPPGYFRSRTALCSLGQDLLLSFFFLLWRLPPVLLLLCKMISSLTLLAAFIPGLYHNTLPVQ